MEIFSSATKSPLTRMSLGIISIQINDVATNSETGFRRATTVRRIKK